MKKYIFTLLAGLQILVAGMSASAQRITVTVAGNGTPAYTGNNGAGRAAALNGPLDVCTDGAKCLYFSDQANGLVRRLSLATGVITTIAGGGSSTADGVPATSASLEPNFLCINAAGNILYTTTLNNQVRKINLYTGTITTIAGSTAAGYGGDGGPAAVATLNGPEGICADAAENVYIADRWNNRVRVIDGATGVITTFAGNGVPTYLPTTGPATASPLHSPIALCLDASGNLFISDQEPNYPAGTSYIDAAVIRKVTAATGIMTDFVGAPAGSGLASGISSGVPLLTAFLGEITGMCADIAGNLYCNEMSCSCREANLATDTLDLVGGNFTTESFSDDTASPSAYMNFSMGLCMDHAGDIYIADSVNNRIRKLIPLSHTPTFAFGPGQYIDPAAATTVPVDSLLWITDIDSGQSETWTVITPPAHGALAGLPFSAPCRGLATTAKTVGVTYTPLAAYADSDRFEVSVSDGLLSDTMTIYVGARSLPPVVYSPPPTPSGVAAIAISVPIIDLFPNPGNAMLNIRYSSFPSGSISIGISDITGGAVYDGSFVGNSNSGMAQIDVRALPPGLYLVKVNGGEVRKWVKE